MLLCFSIILSTSKSLMRRRWKKKRKGPGMRQISSAFPSHNGSHLNSPIYCWSPFWMVPLMKCCFCGSSHEFQRPRGYIFLFLSLTSKLSGMGRAGMKKLRGHQVQRCMLFTKCLTMSFKLCHYTIHHFKHGGVSELQERNKSPWFFLTLNKPLWDRKYMRLRLHYSAFIQTWHLSYMHCCKHCFQTYKLKNENINK